MSDDNMKLVEIVDAETKVSDIAIPSTVTGYFAYYKTSTGKWDAVTTFDPNRGNHPVLPYWAFETKQEAVKSAMALKAVGFIKIVAVDFEV